MRYPHSIALMLGGILLYAVAGACSNAGNKKESDNPAPKIPDTLRVATLYSPTSYFIYRDETMGYDYSLLKQFVRDKGIELNLTVASSLQKMMEMLDSGEVDLLAYEIPVTAEFKQRVLACGPSSVNYQVLVQPKNNPEGLIVDETQLVGKDIYVESASKYLYRLKNLNQELGGGINIHVINRDTLITEDLIEMVSKGEIPLTIVDSDIARLNKTYYRDLDISLPLSFSQKASWAVRHSDQYLADTIDMWFENERQSGKQATLLKRYFELSKGSDLSDGFKLDFSRGRFSPYDPLFRKYAPESHCDWRILAAQAYRESHFDTTKVSWAGARGIMQIMPATALAFGLEHQNIENPEANIATAAKILADLHRSFAKRVPDPEERVKFILAAYNSGIAHILDAIALAQKYGKNPRVWTSNVEVALLMKSNPEYYSDSVCRAGYFRGRETVAYVNDVLEIFSLAKEKIK